MATAFLQLSSIAGSSTDPSHRRWISIQSWSYAVSMPRKQQQDFSFVTSTKEVNAAALMSQLASNKPIPFAKLDARSSSAEKGGIQLTLTDPLVTRVEVGGKDVSFTLTTRKWQEYVLPRHR